MCIKSSFISVSLTVAVPVTIFFWSGPIAMQLSNHHFGINHSTDFQKLGKTLQAGLAISDSKIHNPPSLC